MRAKTLLFVLNLYGDGCCGGVKLLSERKREREREMEALEIDKGKRRKMI